MQMHSVMPKGVNTRPTYVYYMVLYGAVFTYLVLKGILKVSFAR
jgi:hypothetical protein